MKNKHPTSVRLSAEALRLMAKLSDTLAISQTAVLEMAIREFAKRKLPPATPKKDTSDHG